MEEKQYRIKYTKGELGMGNAREEITYNVFIGILPDKVIREKIEDEI